MVKSTGKQLYSGVFKIGNCRIIINHAIIVIFELAMNKITFHIVL